MRISSLAPLLLFASSVSAQGFSTPELFDDATRRRFTPSGERLVYTKRVSTGFGSSHEVLYAVPTDDPFADVQLATQSDDDTVPDFALTADGQEVVFLLGQGSAVPFQLYVTAVDGSGSPTLLAGTSHAGEFLLTMDRVVFVAEQTPGVLELFSAPVDGSSAATKLSGAMTTGGNVVTEGAGRRRALTITPDGQTVLYVADQDVDEVFELFSVPTDGSAAPTKLSGSMTAGGDVEVDHALSYFSALVPPSGDAALFLADRQTDGLVELFSVAIDGSWGPVCLSNSGNGSVLGTAMTSDGENALFVQQDGATQTLSRIESGSTTPQAIRATTAPSSWLTLSEDGQWTAWQERTDNGDGTYTWDVWTAELGGASQLVASYSSQRWLPGSLGLSPTSSHAVFSPSHDVFTGIGGLVQSVPMQGGALTTLNSGAATLGSFAGFVPGTDTVLLEEVRSSPSGPTAFLAAIPSDGSGTLRRITPDQGAVFLGRLDWNATARCVAFDWVAFGGFESSYLTFREVALEAAGPASGGIAGGTQVVLAGSGFSASTRVWFGRQPAASVTFLDEQTLLAVSPATSFGPGPLKAVQLEKPVDLVVRDLETSARLRRGFTYRR